MEAMNPQQKEELKKARSELVQSDMEAWKFLLEFHRISDQDIKEIVDRNRINEWGKWVSDDHTASSDDARRAILKIYSYETPLYSALNRANQWQDESAIATLGPFSYLLSFTLRNPT